jgi:ABC-type uncharacterized transport system auxiliary subunit
MKRQGDEAMIIPPGLKRTQTCLPLPLPGKTAIAAAALALLLYGCSGGGQAVRQYALDYAPAAQQAIVTLPDSIAVAPFTSAQLYRGTAMIYQEEQFRRDQYLYNRWRVNPADMVTDCLTRDLRSAGLFRGVFNYRNAESCRYLLAGSIEEFEELTGKHGRQAVLSLNITLLDTSRQEFTDRLLFQKNYRVAEPIDGDAPVGLAKGMSQALEKVSVLLQSDIYQAVQASREQHGK